MKNKKTIDYTTLIYGKVPPNASDLENEVIGMLMENGRLYLDASMIISDLDFYKDENKRIFKAISDIHQAHDMPNVTMVIQRLKEVGELDEVGGAYAILQKSKLVTSTVNLSKYCKIIKQKSIQRKLIEMSGLIITKSYEEEEDVFDILHEAENELKGINNEIQDIQTSSMADVAMNILNKFNNKVYKAKNDIKDDDTIYTGIPEWDRINGALFNGLYVIAGRPGMGKGVHMTELAKRMGQQYPIGIINGEMTDEQLLLRIGCNIMGIDNFLFKKNPKLVTEAEQSILSEAMEHAVNLNLHVYSNRRIDKIASKIKLWVDKYKVKAILADFLTLFTIPPELERYYTSKQKVDYILDVYVSLAKTLKVPIFLYVQMNRGILARGGAKEPTLADLKESGSIEELAFQVMFLHRPEYYDKTAIVDEMGQDIKGLMNCIIAKHRDGVLDDFKMKAELSKSQLLDWGYFVNPYGELDSGMMF